jgi:hypothetical protein
MYAQVSKNISRCVNCIIEAEADPHEGHRLDIAELHRSRMSRDSDWLEAGRLCKNFHFSMSSRPSLRPNQPPI